MKINNSFILKDGNGNVISNKEYTFTEDENSLDLSRIFFLTSEYTASASEAVINALKPYMDVITIGSTTHGKPVGMSAKTNSAKYIYRLINFGIYNSDDVGEYFDGLYPNCTIYDSLFYSRGNVEESLLKEALAFIDDGRCSISSRSDFDADGVFDYIDEDDDNDGVNDSEDSHPKNRECSRGNLEDKGVCFEDVINRKLR